jgi:hypothetical protein
MANMRTSRTTLRIAGALLGVVVLAGVASADEPAGPATEPAAKPKPKLLGITASLTGTYQRQVGDSRTSMLIGKVEYKRPRGPSFFAHLGWVQDAGADASAVSNLVLGGSMPISLPRGFGLTVRALVVVPVGTAGGDDADVGALRASLAGTDWNGPIFAPNHLTGSGGARLSFGRGPLYAFFDTGLYYASRVRGEGIDPVGPSVTFSASQLVAGIAPTSALFLYAGAVQTRYFGHPEFLGDNPAALDDHYAVLGLEATIDVGGRSLRPGLLVGRAVDAPKVGREFRIVELSLAFGF